MSEKTTELCRFSNAQTQIEAAAARPPPVARRIGRGFCPAVTPMPSLGRSSRERLEDVANIAPQDQVRFRIERSGLVVHDDQAGPVQPG
jgi:hypothetical protein